MGYPSSLPPPPLGFEIFKSLYLSHFWPDRSFPHHIWNRTIDLDTFKNGNKTKVICANSKFELRNVHPWKIFIPKKYSSVKNRSPGDKLSENIWFAWSRTSYGGDKWRCHTWSQTHTRTCEYRARILWMLTEFAILFNHKMSVSLSGWNAWM